jgi:uncharacterized membrane protein
MTDFSKQIKETPEMMSKNPKYWKVPFYFNPKDPRMTVPKLDSSMGLGSTPNLGKIQIQIAIAAIILIPIIYKCFF